MTKTVLPEAKNWNAYWALDETERFTKISWSKRRIRAVLAPYVKIKGKALDAGCGSGFFAKYFCDEGMTTTALDYSEAALRLTERATGGRCRILKEDLCRVALGREIDDRFDIIFSDGLLEHFPTHDQDRILDNLVSLLSDCGVIVTFVPNRYSPWEWIRPFYMPGIEETPFVLSELSALHERHGLKILAKGGVNTFPFAFSPDRVSGGFLGMLLYTVAAKK